MNTTDFLASLNREQLTFLAAQSGQLAVDASDALDGLELNDLLDFQEQQHQLCLDCGSSFCAQCRDQFGAD